MFQDENLDASSLIDEMRRKQRAEAARQARMRAEADQSRGMLGSENLRSSNVQLTEDRLSEMIRREQENEQMRSEALRLMLERARKPQADIMREMKDNRLAKNPVLRALQKLDHWYRGVGRNDDILAQKQYESNQNDLRDLLKDQGLELSRSHGQQAQLYKAIEELRFKRDAAANKSAQTEQDLSLKTGENARRAGMTEADILKRDAETAKLKKQTDYMVPFGTDKAAATERFYDLLGDKGPELRKRAEQSKYFDALLKAATQGSSTSSTTRDTLVVNPDGTARPVPMRSTTTKSSPMSQAAREFLGQYMETPPQAQSQGGSPASKIVAQALQNTNEASRNQNKAVRYLSSPDDRKLIESGRTQKLEIDPQAAGDGVFFKSNADRKDYQISAGTSGDIMSLGRGISEAYADGTAQKVFGPLNNKLSAIRRTRGSLGSALGGVPVIGGLFKTPDQEGDNDPSQNIARQQSIEIERALKPAAGDDLKTASFKRWLQSTAANLTMDIQKDKTGLVALAREMNLIASSIPQITDSAQQAMLAINTLAMKRSVEDYKKKLPPGVRAELDRNLGDFSTPVLLELVPKLEDVRSRATLGKLDSKELGKLIPAATYDAEEIIGKYLQSTGRSVRGLNVRSLEEKPAKDEVKRKRREAIRKNLKALGM